MSVEADPVSGKFVIAAHDSRGASSVTTPRWGLGDSGDYGAVDNTASAKAVTARSISVSLTMSGGIQRKMLP